MVRAVAALKKSAAPSQGSGKRFPRKRKRKTTYSQLRMAVPASSFMIVCPLTIEAGRRDASPYRARVSQPLTTLRRTSVAKRTQMTTQSQKSDRGAGWPARTLHEPAAV
jgi:hypothetical protein